MHNIDTFHNNKMIGAETVGFRFEAGLFKTVQIIQGVGCHAAMFIVTAYGKQVSKDVAFVCGKGPVSQSGAFACSKR